MSLDQRRIVITGASSGIGAATARALAAAGARVGLIARRQEPLDELAAELGDAATVAAADVTDVEAAGDAMSDLADALGGIDGLVNSAGVYRPLLVADAPIDEVRSMFDVNVIGLVAATQAALPYLTAEPHADLVNVSSMSGRRIPGANGALYAATKFAAHAISAGLRMELDGTSVRTTTFAPGFVDTPIGDDVPGDDGAEFRAKLSQHGMSAESAAALIVGAIAAPPDTEVIELAVMPRRRG